LDATHIGCQIDRQRGANTPGRWGP
jgi:hypothetical protein